MVPQVPVLVCGRGNFTSQTSVNEDTRICILESVAQGSAPEKRSSNLTGWHVVTAQVAPIPDDIQDRRVEITGPVDRKMVINALNSGANVFMADFEDSNAPTW